MISEVYNIDCMIGMAEYPDNYFDLAVIDPPYGIGINKQSQGKGGGVAKKNEYVKKTWDNDAPNPEYFDLLVRKSKHQIIWGANHFIDNFPFMSNSPCWIVWDKDNGGTDFADAELAWTSFNTAVRIFKWKWSGMLQQNMKHKETRIHPTQKPVALYKWLLKNYAKEGDTILDTHLGSSSSRIAAHDMGFDFTGYEIDADYFKASELRFNNHIQQQSLFKPKEMY